ncbi:hypothetical protein GGR57DRAFT_119682 [Xylariaceae sp. FL1272]|nr:hypothetical protein GGR57DRAFT_119682 [Xylariaceae sp. FL1272]
MHLRSVIAVAGGLATATNALLLPPDVPDSEVITTLPIAESPFDVSILEHYNVLSEQTVNLKCPGCLRAHHHPKRPTNPKGKGHRKAEQKPELSPIPGKQEKEAHHGKGGHVPGHHKGKPHKEIPSHLKLDFTVQATENGDILAVNGFELYPNPDPSRGLPLAAVLPNKHPKHHSKQEPKDALDEFMNHASHVDSHGIPEHAYKTLGFGMHSYTVPTTDMGDAALVNVELQIMEVGDVFVNGIPDVVVSLVQTGSGKLAMAKIDTIERTVESPMGGQKDKECTTMLCRWKAALLGPFRKGCGRKGAGMAGDRPPPPPYHGHHGHHEEHEHRHGHVRFVAKFLTNIILPVLVGILAGISAGLIGMMIGTAIVYTWRFFFRRGGKTHGCRYSRRCKKAKLQDATAEDEKSGLMVNEEEIEAPPAYVENGKGQIEI